MNENDIDTVQKSMYEQDKRSDETWKQMSDRVGFTKWYESQWFKSKNVGDVYAKRRQRWLANTCKDKKIIKSEIENLEDCIEFAYLNDDNYLESVKKTDNDEISELKQQVKDLQTRIEQLTNLNNEKEKSKCLSLHNVDIDAIYDPCEFSYGGYDEKFQWIAKNMFSEIRKQMKTLSYMIHPSGTIERWRLRCKREAGDFERYKVLIITDTYEIQSEKYINDFVDILNNKFGMECTSKEICYITLDGYQYEGKSMMRQNVGRIRQFMRSDNPDVVIQYYKGKESWGSSFECQGFCFFAIRLA